MAKQKRSPGQTPWRERLIRSHGLTHDEAARFRAGKCCEICGAPGPEEKLAVDHCHKELLIRGVLCYACNAAIGMFKDDPVLMRAAAAYVERPGLSVDEVRAQLAATSATT